MNTSTNITHQPVPEGLQMAVSVDSITPNNTHQPVPDSLQMAVSVDNLTSQPATSSLHYDNLAHLNEMDVFFEQKRKATASAQGVEFINQVQKNMCSHWQNEQFTVKTMFQLIAMPYSTASRRFQFLLGCSAVEVLRDYRLSNSCRLLLNPAVNISETGYRCGFADPKYYSRCFRKKYGLTPSEYREKYIRSACSMSIQGEILLEKAIKLLERDEDIFELNFDRFADELNVSKTTLYRRLKTITGQSPCEFIRRYRLNKSVDMLMLSEVKIKDIATSVGFYDSTHFSRCFTNEFGVSPMSFRRINSEK